MSYTPDFKVVELDQTVKYHEIKGWFDSASKTRLKRMAKYYPEIVVVVVGQKEYNALAKSVSGFIANWETKGKKFPVLPEWTQDYKTV